MDTIYIIIIVLVVAVVLGFVIRFAIIPKIRARYKAHKAKKANQSGGYYDYID